MAQNKKVEEEVEEIKPEGDFEESKEFPFSNQKLKKSDNKKYEVVLLSPKYAFINKDGSIVRIPPRDGISLGDKIKI